VGCGTLGALLGGSCCWPAESAGLLVCWSAGVLACWKCWPAGVLEVRWSQQWAVYQARRGGRGQCTVACPAVCCQCFSPLKCSPSAQHRSQRTALRFCPCHQPSHTLTGTSPACCCRVTSAVSASSARHSSTRLTWRCCTAASCLWRQGRGTGRCGGSSRTQAWSCRWGGEEFVMAVADGDGSEAGGVWMWALAMH
jgi:hypothetical protein